MPQPMPGMEHHDPAIMAMGAGSGPPYYPASAELSAAAGYTTSYPPGLEPAVGGSAPGEGYYADLPYAAPIPSSEQKPEKKAEKAESDTQETTGGQKTRGTRRGKTGGA